MGRFTGIELGMLAFAAFFLVGGVIMALHPTESVVFHPGRGRGSLQHLSKGGTQIFGVMEIIFGIGFVWMVFYKRGK